jgi:poly(glycerol-phosphate) alpha-glucosyltransferase
MLDQWALRNSAIRKKLAGWLYEKINLSRACCIHALCESEAKAIRAYGLCNPVAVIPNGVDIPKGEDAFSSAWQRVLLPEVKVLLCLGRLHPKKNLEALIVAWAGLFSADDTRLGNWALVIAGWDQGGYERQLRRVVAETGARAVHFIGPQYGESKAVCFRNADAFILPSLSEGLPMVVLEAWSYGLPVIMTRECNLPQGFTAGAALETTTDAEGIRDSLIQLINLTDGDRASMGAAGMELASKRFSWKQIAAEMFEVYQWVLGEADPPSCVRFD